MRRSDTKHAQKDSGGADRSVFLVILNLFAVFVSNILLIDCHSNNIAVIKQESHFLNR